MTLRELMPEDFLLALKLPVCPESYLAGAMATASLRLTEEQILSVLDKEFQGDPVIIAGCFLYAAADLEDALAIGRRAIAKGGWAAMAGHALLRTVTLQPIQPDSRLWNPQMSKLVSIDTRAWDFLAEMKEPTYTALILRGLRLAKSEPRRPDWATRMVEFLIFAGGHEGASAYDRLAVEDLDAWVQRTNRPMTLRNAQEFYGRRRMVEAGFLAGTGQISDSRR